MDGAWTESTGAEKRNNRLSGKFKQINKLSLKRITAPSTKQTLPRPTPICQLVIFRIFSQEFAWNKEASYQGSIKMGFFNCDRNYDKWKDTSQTLDLSHCSSIKPAKFHFFVLLNVGDLRDVRHQSCKHPKRNLLAVTGDVTWKAPLIQF